MNRRRPSKQEAAFTPTTYRCQIVSRVGQQAQAVYGSLLSFRSSVVRSLQKLDGENRALAKTDD